MDAIWIISEYLPITHHRYLIVAIGGHPSLVGMEELLVTGSAIDEHPHLAYIILRTIAARDVMPCISACSRLVASAVRLGIFVDDLTEYPEINSLYRSAIISSPEVCIANTPVSDVPGEILHLVPDHILVVIFDRYRNDVYEGWWRDAFVRLAQFSPEYIAGIIEKYPYGHRAYLLRDVSRGLIPYLTSCVAFSIIFGVNARTIEDARAKIDTGHPCTKNNVINHHIQGITKRH